MDLVVGATGNVGKAVAVRLRQEGRAVRAMIRGGAARPEAQDLGKLEVEIADADLTRPETLPAALAGIETVVCTATTMPHGRDDGLRRVDHDGVLALIDAAENGGARRFIYTSYSGNIREDCPLHTAKRDCENRLLAGKMAAIVLRPSYFMEAWLSPALGFDPAKRTARIYGTGENKISYISARDVVEFAVAAATRPEPGNAVLEMGGPEPLSQLEAVQVFERAVGRKFSLEFVSLAVLEAQHAAASDPLQKTFAALTLAYAKGDVIQGARATAERYGVELRSVADHAATFR